MQIKFESMQARQLVSSRLRLSKRRLGASLINLQQYISKVSSVTSFQRREPKRTNTQPQLRILNHLFKIRGLRGTRSFTYDLLWFRFFFKEIVCCLRTWTFFSGIHLLSIPSSIPLLLNAGGNPVMDHPGGSRYTRRIPVVRRRTDLSSMTPVEKFSALRSKV